MKKLLKALVNVLIIMLITLTTIEIILQVAFLSLPQAIIQRMPQYPERYGIQFNTQHGARQYPANEAVDFEVDQFSGDLYQISCLSPIDAVDIEPYRVTYTRNEYGFRTPSNSSDSAQIVIVGDSFTAAESIESPFWANLSESTFVLGLPGSGTIEQSILLEEFGVPNNPAIIILAYFAGNDLTDNQTFSELQKQNQTFADATHQNRILLEYLVTYHLALYIRDILATPTISDCHYPVTAQTSPPTPIAFYDSMVSLLALNKSQLEASLAYQSTTESIIEIAELANIHDAHFVLAYIPQKAEIYWQLLDNTTKDTIVEHLPQNKINPQVTVSVENINDNVDTQRQLLIDLAQTHNFDFIDFTSPLTDAVIDGQQPYFFADTHWNQVGHDIAGEALASFLSQVTLD